MMFRWQVFLGTERTLKRIRGRFWLPSVAKDMADYCRTCVECQKISQKVPLVPMSIIPEPFEIKAMDVIEPIPKTTAGKQFVLVLSNWSIPEMLEDYWIYWRKNGYQQKILVKMLLLMSLLLIKEWIMHNSWYKNIWGKINRNRKSGMIVKLVRWRRRRGPSTTPIAAQGQSKEVHEDCQDPFKIKQKLGLVNYEVIIDSIGNTKV